MPRNKVFFKGKKKKRNMAIVPMVIVLALISAVIVLFYSMQKYAVITKENVKVVMPFMKENDTVTDESGNEVKVFDKVDVSVVFNDPDYSAIPATAGNNVPELRAIYISADEVNRDKLLEYAGRLSSGNALILEMKPRDGYLKWNSEALLAYAYALSGENENTISVEQTIAELKDKGVYLVAQISCCIDKLMCSSTSSVTLKNAFGATYTNDVGMWLDPYNVSVRQYIVDMVNELYQLGFDEVVLADLMHPVLGENEDVVYTRYTSTPQNQVNAVCSLAVYLADELKDRQGLLSVYCDSAKALVKADTDNGQDARLFMKLFDRVYYRTDKYAYTFNVDDIKNHVEIGNVHDRLIPVVENYLPENTSWVYIETATQ